jgi:hypothetical protein
LGALPSPRIEASANAFPNDLALLDDGSGTTYTYQDRENAEL